MLYYILVLLGRLGRKTKTTPAPRALHAKLSTHRLGLLSTTSDGTARTIAAPLFALAIEEGKVRESRGHAGRTYTYTYVYYESRISLATVSTRIKFLRVQRTTVGA